MTPPVRAADTGDVNAVAAILATAFKDDPYVGWLLPDSKSRVARATQMFTALTRHHLQHGHVDITVDPTGTVQAAALWAPPGHWQHTIRAQRNMLPGLLRAFGPRIPRLGLADLQKQRAHPNEPHWYLQAIGTSPPARGLGHGRSLLQSRLTPCDQETTPAYLETSNPENLPYYERFGFTVSNEIKMHFAGPPTWLMWRPPQQDNH